MRQFFLSILFLLLAVTTAQAQKAAKGGKAKDGDDRAVFYFLEGQRQMQARNLDAAFELFNYSKQLDPDNPAVLYYLSPLNVALQRDSVATVDMLRATQLAPDNYWYLDLLAKLHFSGNRPEEGIEVLEKMNARWSDKTELLYMLIDAYASQHKADSLLSAIGRLEVKEGKTEQTTLEKIQIYVQRADVKSIYEELSALLAVNPNSQMPVQLLLSILREKKDAFNLLGDLYHQAGNDDRAFQYYDSCLVYSPDDPTVLNNYAYYLSLYQRDLDTAEEMSRRSNDLSPDNPTFLDTLAWILYNKGRYEEAKQYMDRVEALMKEEEKQASPDVLEHIQKINEKVKEK